MQNLKEDDSIVTQKSQRQRSTKSFDDDYIIYLVDDTPRTIEEAYFSLGAYLKKAVWSDMIQLCLIELGNRLASLWI